MSSFGRFTGGTIREAPTLQRKLDMIALGEDIREEDYRRKLQRYTGETSPTILTHASTPAIVEFLENETKGIEFSQNASDMHASNTDYIIQCMAGALVTQLKQVEPQVAAFASRARTIEERENLREQFWMTNRQAMNNVLVGMLRGATAKMDMDKREEQLFADEMFLRTTLSARRKQEENTASMIPQMTKESGMARREWHDAQMQAYHERQMAESVNFPNRATVPRSHFLAGW